MSRPSTSPSSTKTRRLVVSFHDLHPGSMGACRAFLELLRAAGVPRATLLVVPRWHGGERFDRDAAFVAGLRELVGAGHELCLHGWNHLGGPPPPGRWARLVATRYTAGEGEFYTIDEPEASRRLAEGLECLRAAGLAVWGFTPPAWLLSAGGRAALRRAGFHYTTTWGAVERLTADDALAAPVLTYSSRAAWRRIVSRSWVRAWGALHARSPLLRIAVHPGDLRFPAVARSIERLLRRGAADRVACRYCDLLPAGARPLTP